LNVKNLTSATT